MRPRLWSTMLYVPGSFGVNSTTVAPPADTWVVWTLVSGSLVTDPLRVDAIEDGADHVEARGQVWSADAEEDAHRLTDVGFEGVGAGRRADRAAVPHAPASTARMLAEHKRLRDAAMSMHPRAGRWQETCGCSCPARRGAAVPCPCTPAGVACPPERKPSFDHAERHGEVPPPVPAGRRGPPEALH